MSLKLNAKEFVPSGAGKRSFAIADATGRMEALHLRERTPSPSPHQMASGGSNSNTNTPAALAAQQQQQSFAPVDPVIDAAAEKVAAAWTLLTETGTATQPMEEQQAAAAATIAGLLKEHGPILLTRPVTYTLPLVSPSSSSSSLSSLASGSGGGGITVIVSLLKGIQSALETAEGGSGRSQGLGRVRQGALTAITAMCETLGQEGWFEPYALSLLRRVLSSYKGAKAIVLAADKAAKAILGITSTHGVRPALNAIFEGMGPLNEWQVKEGSISLLGELVSDALKAAASNSEDGSQMRQQVAKVLPDVILKLIESLSDTRPAVKQAALKVFPEVCAVITNTDVKGIIPTVIQAYADPSKTEAGLDALSGCTFIQVVDAPTLGLMLPILMRGMKERRALTKRKCALIIGNMCKLVADPRDAAQFYPVLHPVLSRALEEATNEDVKDVCARAVERLTDVRGALREARDRSEEKARVLPHLKTAVQHHKHDAPALYEEVLDFVADAGVDLLEEGCTDQAEWITQLAPRLIAIMGSEEKGRKAAGEFAEWCLTGIETDGGDDDEDDALDVVNTEFSLGYGGKILLHNTKLHLKRGRRYGIVGKNGCGKTTLMRNIANGSLEGLPEGLKTVYVESNPASHLDTPVAVYVTEDENLKGKITLQDAQAKLTEFDFPPSLQMAPLSSLSGGWRMKLALAQAMLTDPDMLLLDEPTNHLDVNAVAWLTHYLQSLKHVTVLMVSHSTSFLDDVCTDIIHYEEQKLVPYHGNLSAFVAKRPDAKHYYELSTETLKFNFPIPGRLEGVNSRSQTILKMEHVTFTYPGREIPQLKDVSLRLTRQSRVAVVGANGAGKSTLIKLLVGETLPDEGCGEVWKHHNLRLAYVAQHSFHHVEQHLEESPVDYFKWRFHNGLDKELLTKEALALTEEEERKLKTDKYGSVEELRNRRTRGGVLEYEVKFVGMHERDNKYLTKQELEDMGFANLVKQCDERVAAEAAGLDLRPLITKVIQKHLDDFGLPQEFGTYGKIRGLSGGQKVKLVLAAAMWNQPHLLVLDEPTNFLDREALGAFATAIREFQGGVIMISHDREFMQALCTETWLVENGEVDIVEEEMVEGKIVRKKKEKKEEELSDAGKIMNAGGNTNSAKEVKVELDFWGKPLSAKEIRKKQRAAKAAEKEAAKLAAQPKK